MKRMVEAGKRKRGSERRAEAGRTLGREG